MRRGAIYRHFDRDGNLLYIGKTTRPIKRQSEHEIVSEWFSKVCRIEIEFLDNSTEVEKEIIRKERPIHNSVRYQLTKNLNIRITDEDLQELTEHAKMLKLSIPDLVRYIFKEMLRGRSEGNTREGQA